MKSLCVEITVDFQPENLGTNSGWEATLDDGTGYEAGDVGVLLAHVAADLRTESAQY